MNVLSLFDGISVAQIALNRAGIPIENYYASEIDPYAISITMKNFPNTIQVGSVTTVNGKQFPKIDLLIGGSPCQDLSIAKKGERKGLNGQRSSLFFEYVRIWDEVQPTYFVFENVESMDDEFREAITTIFGVEPIMIDASLVSAQQRKRLFWTNIPNVQQPEDRGIIIKDILEPDAVRKMIIPINPVKTKRGIKWDTSGKGYFSQQDRAYSILGKFPTIPTARTITKLNVMFEDDTVGILTWKEAERLQSFPDNYTDLGLQNKIEKRGGVIGNAFNADVATHILSYLKNK